ncbi:MAG: hypothetical protein NXI20_28725 [bacterium]|nr:hypothetical protein [bacterium]
MADVTIYLSLVGSTTQLHLSDSEGHSGDGTITTDVNKGDNVTWQIASGANISSIDSIYDKVAHNIFSSGPSSQSDGTWQGTVSGSASGSESYGIKYTVNGTQYDDDPELKVKN